MGGRLPQIALIEPALEDVLAFCADEPVERVFLEDMARRGLGRFVALERDGRLDAVCHAGVNVVPSGRGCDAFAEVAARGAPKMLIGDEGAVTELWEAARELMPAAREDRPSQPVYAIDSPPERGRTALRAATARDMDLLVPACAAAYREEIGVDPLAVDGDGFRWRTRVQIDEGRSWLWEEDGTILFKAEASAWTPHAVQIQQVWVDPAVRNRGYAKRGLRDLCRLLLRRAATVTLFVRPENTAAIRVYEGIGMRRAGTYRTVIFSREWNKPSSFVTAKASTPPLSG